MKINLLYLLIPAALLGCYLIIHDLQGKSAQSFFGTAETEPSILSTDYDGRVAQLNVRIGQEVKAGDTLLIMHRTELSRQAFLLEADLKNRATELDASTAELRNKITVMQTETQRNIFEYQAEIRQIEIKDSIEQTLRAALLPGVKSVNKESQTQIASLRIAIAQAEAQFQHERKLLQDQMAGQQAIARSKQNEVQGKQAWQTDDKKALYLIAPVSGYVDQVNVTQGSMVQAYKELLRIYPTRAAKVIGFIHETAAIPYRIGDSVSIVSVTRPGVSHSGQIIATSPKLVELPLRLRKFVEVRTWGREVMIHVPAENSLYIGEKVNITIQQQPKQ